MKKSLKILLSTIFVVLTGALLVSCGETKPKKQIEDNNQQGSKQKEQKDQPKKEQQDSEEKDQPKKEQQDSEEKDQPKKEQQGRDEKDQPKNETTLTKLSEITKENIGKEISLTVDIIGIDRGNNEGFITLGNKESNQEVIAYSSNNKSFIEGSTIQLKAKIVDLLDPTFYKSIPYIKKLAEEALKNHKIEDLRKSTPNQGIILTDIKDVKILKNPSVKTQPIQEKESKETVEKKANTDQKETEK